MYVKSVAVLAQVLCIVTLGPLADSRQYIETRCYGQADMAAYWRKRLLVTSAYTGSISCSLILLFPSKPHSFTPLLTAIITVIGNAAYGTSIVCANAFLSGLARDDPEVQALSRAHQSDDSVDAHTDLELTYSRASIEDEARHLLPAPLPERLLPAVTAISTSDLAETPASPSPGPNGHYNALLSLTISRISSIGTALGFLSGVSVLALLIIPVTLMGGTTSSLRVAVGVSAIWWAVFTIPAWRGLPGGGKSVDQHRATGVSSLAHGWKRVATMIKPSEIKSLPNLFTFLLAWIFLSDGTPLYIPTQSADKKDSTPRHTLRSSTPPLHYEWGHLKSS